MPQIELLDLLIVQCTTTDGPQRCRNIKEPMLGKKCYTKKLLNPNPMAPNNKDDYIADFIMLQI